MLVKIHADRVPPRAELLDADDFASFKVVVVVGEHIHVPVAELERLAGAKAEEASWRAGLEGMLRYADEHGWLDASGAVRAHVEVTGDGEIA